MPKPILTQEIVRTLLRYDRASGVFFWKPRKEAKKNWNTRYAGRPAGYIFRPQPHTEYIAIRIFDWPFLAHRVAWLHVKGCWPDRTIDHRDGDGLNNRWRNLRRATRSQNQMNRGVQKSNKLGLKGVCQSPSGRFRATIGAQRRQIHLGHFDTPEEAHAAYVTAAEAIHGRFARTR